MVPDGSKMDSLLAKVKPFSDVGRTSVITYIRRVTDGPHQQLSISMSGHCPVFSLLLTKLLTRGHATSEVYNKHNLEIPLKWIISKTQDFLLRKAA